MKVGVCTDIVLCVVRNSNQTKVDSTMYTTRSNILRIVLVISVCCVITARSEMGETHGFNEEFSYLRSNRENNKDSILILGGLGESNKLETIS